MYVDGHMNGCLNIIGPIEFRIEMKLDRKYSSVLCFCVASYIFPCDACQCTLGIATRMHFGKSQKCSRNKNVQEEKYFSFSLLLLLLFGILGAVAWRRQRYAISECVCVCVYFLGLCAVIFTYLNT